MNEDQAALVGLVDAILRGRTDNDQLAKTEADDSTVDDALWRELADAGVLGIAVPEALGGAALGLTELCLVLEQVGRRVAPVPVWETGLAGLALARFGSVQQQARWLPGLADGSLRLSLVLDLDGVASAIAWDGSLSGTAPLVPHGDTADALLVAAGEDLVLVATEGLTRTAVRTTNHELGADVVLAGGELVASGLAVSWLRERARVGLAAMQLGVADAGVREAAAYLSEREQFGRPLATFQATSQQLGDAYCDVQAMRATLWQAVHVLERDDLPSAATGAAVGVATWWATDAAERIQHTVQHLHGGMGADTTYPVHRRLLWTMRHGAQLGGPSRQLERLGDAVVTLPL